MHGPLESCTKTQRPRKHLCVLSFREKGLVTSPLLEMATPLGQLVHLFIHGLID